MESVQRDIPSTNAHHWWSRANIKRSIGWGLRAAAIVGLGGSAYFTAKTVVVRAQSMQSVKVSPYSAERWHISYIIHPEGAVERITALEKARDGAFVERVVAVFGGPGEIPTRRVTLPTGVEALICDSCKFRTTVRLMPEELASFKNEVQRTTCGDPGEVMTGHERVAGHDVEVWETTQTVGAQRSRLKMERAPDLGCVALRVSEEQAERDGDFKLRWEEVAKKLTLGDPPEADFDLAKDYREVPPSEMVFAVKPFALKMKRALEEPGYCAATPNECALISRDLERVERTDSWYELRHAR